MSAVTCTFMLLFADCMFQIHTGNNNVDGSIPTEIGNLENLAEINFGKFRE